MAVTRALRIAGFLAVLFVVGTVAAVAQPASNANQMLVPMSRSALLAVQSLPAPALTDGVDAWVAPGTGRQVIDDFEGASWPDNDVWGYVLDLTGDADGAYLWAPSECHASAGQHSLWPIGGGADGVGLSCGSDYPAAQQVSALLALDLTALYVAGTADLMFDVWADAGPNEGLIINYVRFEGSAQSERRTVYSATGRATDWSRDIRLDLTDLRDELDPSWHLDLRGNTGYLELLFLSMPGTPIGEGIFVDNLRLDSELPPPVIVTGEPTITPTPSPTFTPAATPPPTDNTVGCTTEPDCRTLIVEAFDDYRCDGVFKRGRDYSLRGATRVDVTAGAVRLGSPLGAWGSVYFRVPMAAGADVTVTVDPHYADCPNSPNPRHLELSDMDAMDWTRAVFGMSSR